MEAPHQTQRKPARPYGSCGHRRRRLPPLGLGAAALLAAPVSAHAHLVSTGMGPFYDGILHLLLSPAEVMGLVGWVLLAGMQGPSVGRQMMFILPLAWIAGGIGALGIGTSMPVILVAGLGALISGLLVAWDHRLPAQLPVFLAATTSLILGLCSLGTDPAESVAPVGMLGIGAVIFVMVAFGAAAVLGIARDRPRARLVIRVAGSWVAAVGLLMVGWAFR